MYAHASPAVVTAGAREIYAAKTGIDTFQAAVLHKTSGAPSSRYLEVGAGGGHLLRRLRERGHLCFGIDPAQWTNDPWIVPALEDLPGDIIFDGFVLQDVLEHVFDPLQMLVSLREKATSSATMFCSLPCNESRPARRYRGRWAMVRPFGHLHYFSRLSASAMLQRAGWSTVSSALTRITPLKVTLRRFSLRTIAYELLKGGRDQLNLTAVAV